MAENSTAPPPVVEFRNVSKTFNPGRPEQYTALKDEHDHVHGGPVLETETSASSSPTRRSATSSTPARAR